MEQQNPAADCIEPKSDSNCTTSAASEEPVLESLPEKPTVKVELFGQGMLTMFWDDIIEAVRASGYDEIAIANISGALRAQRYLAWGLWIDGKVQAIAVTGTVISDINGKPSAMIHAFHGHVTSEQWAEAMQQFEAALNQSGYAAVCAWTSVPRVVELSGALGWQHKTVCVKDLRYVTIRRFSSNSIATSQ